MSTDAAQLTLTQELLHKHMSVFMMFDAGMQQSLMQLRFVCRLTTSMNDNQHLCS